MIHENKPRLIHPKVFFQNLLNPSMPFNESSNSHSLLLCKCLFFTFFGFSAAFLPFVPLYLSAAGGSQLEIGMICAVRPFLAFLSMPIFGFVTDKLGNTKIMLLVLIAFTTILRLGMLVFTSLWIVTCIIFATEISGQPVSSIIDSAVLDALADPLQYGKQRLFGTIGWGLLAPLTGLAITEWGLNSSIWIYAAGNFMILLLVQRFRVVGAPAATGAVSMSTWRSIFSDPPTLCLVFGTVVMGQAYGAIGAFLFIRLQELGGTPLLMGLTLAVNCAVEAPVFHFAAPAIRRLGLAGVLALVLTLMAARLAFYGLMESPWPVLVVEGVHGITFALLWTAGTAHFRSIGPEGMGATMQGLYGGIGGVGTGMGSLLAGAAAHRLGLPTMFLCSAAYAASAAVVVGVLYLAGPLRPPRRGPVDFAAAAGPYSRFEAAAAAAASAVSDVGSRAEEGLPAAGPALLDPER